MDKIDRNIIRYLQDDADITNAALAEKVNLAPSSCLRRVQRLKRDGVIRKKIAVIDDKAVGRSLTAIVEVDLERHGDHANSVFYEQLKKETCVFQAFSITGDSDLLLVMKLESMEEYQSVSDRLFNHDKNVIRFRTSFVLKDLKP